jgi:hypothetical protein
MTDFDHTDLDRDELLLEPGWVLLQDGPARHQAVLVRHRVDLEVGRSETVESLHPDLTPAEVGGNAPDAGPRGHPSSPDAVVRQGPGFR